jgi:hypothetical protein
MTMDRHWEKLPPKAPEYFEVVKREVAYSDQREGTSYKETLVSVHTSREAAMESIIPKGYIIRPLTVHS